MDTRPDGFPGNLVTMHCSLAGIKSMVPGPPPCSTFAGGSSGFSKPRGGSRKPGSPISWDPRDPRALLYRFSAVLLKSCHLRTPFTFVYLVSVVGLLGSWVVFVYRKVSVESATRQKEGKHIREIVSFCFLRFKEKKIQRMLLGGAKPLYSFRQAHGVRI